jgi:hypothetical protein
MTEPSNSGQRLSITTIAVAEIKPHFFVRNLTRMMLFHELITGEQSDNINHSHKEYINLLKEHKNAFEDAKNAYVLDYRIRTSFLSTEFQAAGAKKIKNDYLIHLNKVTKTFLDMFSIHPNNLK